MPGEGRGYLTLAAGIPRYLEMAVDMALSLREHTAYPVALAADAALAELVRTRYPDIFDTVTELAPRFLGGRALKYGTALASPFENTIFVDADCFVLDTLDPLWKTQPGKDFVMLGELLTLEDDENHHGFSTKALMTRFELDRYLKTNSGIIRFRREAAIGIMEACLACYRDELLPRLRGSALLGRWIGDEIAFGVVGGRLRLGTFPFPAPMYWPHEFPSIDLEHPTKPLLHLIWPPERAVTTELLERAEMRRIGAGVPSADGQHWHEELRSLRRMARRRRGVEWVSKWWGGR